MRAELDAEAYAEAASAQERLRVINGVSCLHMGEAAILYDLYAECAENGSAHLPALEIGARFGCSTLALALAIREHGGAALVSVDPHGFVPARGHLSGSYEIMRDNLRAAGLAEFVTPVLAVSEAVGQWWRHELCLVFIDGNHAAAAVARDIELFAPHVADGGVLCGHDYLKGGTAVEAADERVAEAVDEWVAREGYELEVQQSMWIVRMREAA